MKEIVEKLREMASELEERLRLPAICEDLNIKKAWEMLSSIKDCELEISIARKSYSKRTDIEYKIWDGKKHHASASLANAVTMALDSAAPHDTLDMLAHSLENVARVAVGVEPDQ